MTADRTKKGKLRSARLDIRLNVKSMEKIKQAAMVSEQSLNDFVVTRLLRASDEILARQQIIQLTDRDRVLFLGALEGNVRPNRSLRKAAERFKCSYD